MLVNNVVWEKARLIKVLILDVDGVLTDGRIIYTDNDDELKAFDVKDGFGIRLMHRAGLQTAIITGRCSRIVERRGRELEVAAVFQNSFVKAQAYEELLRQLAVREEETAFIGDDLVDLPVLRRAGLSAAVPEAVQEVKERVDYVTRHGAGRGAVRELAEIILKARGLWEKATDRYF